MPLTIVGIVKGIYLPAEFDEQKHWRVRWGKVVKGRSKLPSLL